MPEPVERSWVVGLPKAEVHLHLEGCVDPPPGRRGCQRQGAPPFAAFGPSDPGLPSPTMHDRRADHQPGPVVVLPGLVLRTHRPGRRSRRHRLRDGPSGHRSRRPTHRRHRQSHPLAPLARAPGRHGRRSRRRLPGRRDRRRGHGRPLRQRETHPDRGPKRSPSSTGYSTRRHPRVAALSIDGNETSGSHNERFAEAFVRAGRGGLRRCAHAGESSGPDGVREAIDLLGAERIDHGVRAVEDPSLVAELARRSIPLDICPTSNVVLGIVADLAHHPVDELRRQGVRVSLNTDDPSALRHRRGRGVRAVCARRSPGAGPELAAIARTSIESCFADEDRRRQLLRDLDDLRRRPRPAEHRRPAIVRPLPPTRSRA